MTPPGNISPDGEFRIAYSGPTERPTPRVVYLTGTGQTLEDVHSERDCHGEHCCIHNPSEHSMRSFPTHWRGDRGIMERTCPHGVGHPDPDCCPPNVIHGCDGCCQRVDAPVVCRICGDENCGGCA